MFEKAAPFTYSTVDMFELFKRIKVKLYGAMLTCLESRSVHIEDSHSMTYNSFIQALRRLITRRGNARQMYSDNGSNFLGAEQELINGFNEMDYTKIWAFLQNNRADWIKWKRKPPPASHLNGIWVCQICLARGILASLLQTHGHSLHEESLQKLIVKTVNDINSQPLTVELINNGQDFNPLSPNNIL